MANSRELAGNQGMPSQWRRTSGEAAGNRRHSWPMAGNRGHVGRETGRAPTARLAHSRALAGPGWPQAQLATKGTGRIVAGNWRGTEGRDGQQRGMPGRRRGTGGEPRARWPTAGDWQVTEGTGRIVVGQRQRTAGTAGRRREPHGTAGRQQGTDGTGGVPAGTYRGTSREILGNEGQQQAPAVDSGEIPGNQGHQ